MINIFEQIKWKIQRANRGFSDKDLWNFDYFLSKTISSGISEMLDKFPKERSEILNLDEIKYGFDLYNYCEENDATKLTIAKSDKAIKDSFKLLSKSFKNLWF